MGRCLFRLLDFDSDPCGNFKFLSCPTLATIKNQLTYINTSSILFIRKIPDKTLTSSAFQNLTLQLVAPATYEYEEKTGRLLSIKGSLKLGESSIGDINIRKGACFIEDRFDWYKAVEALKRFYYVYSITSSEGSFGYLKVEYNSLFKCVRGPNLECSAGEIYESKEDPCKPASGSKRSYCRKSGGICAIEYYYCAEKHLYLLVGIENYGKENETTTKRVDYSSHASYYNVSCESLIYVYGRIRKCELCSRRILVLAEVEKDNNVRKEYVYVPMQVRSYRETTYEEIKELQMHVECKSPNTWTSSFEDDYSFGESDSPSDSLPDSPSDSLPDSPSDSLPDSSSDSLPDSSSEGEVCDDASLVYVIIACESINDVVKQFVTRDDRYCDPGALAVDKLDMNIYAVDIDKDEYGDPYSVQCGYSARSKKEVVLAIVRGYTIITYTHFSLLMDKIGA